jgi:hypothetical protein
MQKRRSQQRWSPALKAAAVIIRDHFKLRHEVSFGDTVAVVETLKRTYDKTTLEPSSRSLFEKIEAAGIVL